MTYQELQQAHDIISQGVIRLIFDNEESFKASLLQGIGATEPYEIERVHCANCYRIHIRFEEDGSGRDVYVDSKDVYSWVV